MRCRGLGHELPVPRVSLLDASYVGPTAWSVIPHELPAPGISLLDARSADDPIMKIECDRPAGISARRSNVFLRLERWLSGR
jgi:hypothetical protein